MEATGESYESRAAHDPIHQRKMLLAMARAYLGPEADPRDPLASPIHADLSGLPPLLIQVGDRETVLDDARVLADRARAAGVSVALEVEEGMIHVFQLYAAELPEARAAIGRIGAFLKARLT
jgi:acetyl esterase/lipase